MDYTALIHKVLLGTATPDEKVALENWIARNAINKAEYEDVRFFYNADQLNIESERHLSDGFRQVKDIVRYRHLKKKRNRAVIVMIAAGITILMIGYFLYEIVT